MPRDFSPYEITHLARFGKSISDVEGETPVEYVTGKAEFGNLVLEVTPDVLIPRVETEELVELVFAQHGADATLIDVGTGSGVIALAYLKRALDEGGKPKIIGLDISKKALEVATNNYMRLFPDQTNIIFLESDLLENLPLDFKPTALIANLPYIPSSDYKRTAESVQKYEPQLALDGGDDGLDLIKKLLKQVQARWETTVPVYLEVDPSHTKELFKKEQLWRGSIQEQKDSFDRHRFIILNT